MKNIEDIELTAIIKTNNSEKNLYNLLESIKDIDEIIIVDEHSSDDTVEIAKEYKANIIYANKNELLPALNQALEEAKGKWIFVIKDNEIIPQKLIYKIKNYIENPKKNAFTIGVSLKTIYLNKEIKAASKKNLIRVFKKGCCKFTSDYSTEIALQQGKIYKLNSNFKEKNAYILSCLNNDIAKNINNIIENNKNIVKNDKKLKSSIFIKPVFKFLYYYIFKSAFFDGKFGYIFSMQMFIEEYLKQLMILEKNED